MMEHKQDHFNHEVRKKERESLQHKERLCKKIMEKKVDKGTARFYMTILIFEMIPSSNNCTLYNL